jgi:hypothetical protein
MSLQMPEIDSIWGYAITKVSNLIGNQVSWREHVIWPGGWRNGSRWHLSLQVWRPNDNNVRFEFISTNFNWCGGVSSVGGWQLKMPVSWILIWVQVTVVSPGHPLGQLTPKARRTIGGKIDWACAKTAPVLAGEEHWRRYACFHLVDLKNINNMNEAFERQFSSVCLGPQITTKFGFTEKKYCSNTLISSIGTYFTM